MTPELQCAEKIIALLETQARCGCWSKMVLAFKIIAICKGE